MTDEPEDLFDDIPFIEDTSQETKPAISEAQKSVMRDRLTDQRRVQQTLMNKPVGFVVDRGGVRSCIVTRGSPPEATKDNAAVRALVSALIRTKRLVGFDDVDQIHEWASFVHNESPWMAPLSAYLMDEMILRVRNRLRFVGFGPVLVHGAPGIGKTHYARVAAQSAGVPVLVMDGATMMSVFQVAGVEKGWASAAPSPIVKLIADTGVANPIVVIDEVDKVGAGDQKAGSAHHALLGLLEGVSAGAWRCPYTEMTIDLSRVSFMMTANDVSKVPQPLLDRCKLIKAQPPSEADLAGFISGRLSGQQDLVVSAVIQACKGRSLRFTDRMINAVLSAGQKPMLH